MFFFISSRYKKHLQLMNHRKQKGRCFATSSLCASHKITTSTDDRHTMLLNWCWRFVAGFFNIFQQKVVQASLFECFAWFRHIVAIIISGFHRNIIEFCKIDTRRNTSTEQITNFHFSRNVKFFVDGTIEFIIAATTSTFRFC